MSEKDYAELKALNTELGKIIECKNGTIATLANIRDRLKAENERLYEEKNCLHKIIDRLLENAGYSKDIASAEDFEDVYENMQYKNNKLEEYKQTLQEIKKIAEIAFAVCDDDCGNANKFKEIIELTKAEEE